MSSRVWWLIGLCIALACACGSVDNNSKPDARVDGPPSSTSCVLGQSMLDSCKL